MKYLIFLFHIIRCFLNVFRPEKFGFLSPYIKVDRELYSKLKELIYKPDENVVNEFEMEMAKSIGDGDCVSFASGRMAFYSIMKSLGIGKGDEVALTGFTCSVMANAVMRLGATPVYVDIDEKTLGMSPDDLKMKLSPKTRIVVAQHTFGIPCEIDKIKEITSNNHIFLVEDCAISFQSIYKGVKIGDWGDASIYSTDHTKPLNSLIGGCVYSKDASLINKIRNIQAKAASLSEEKQESILSRYIYERKVEMLNHNLYPLLFYCDLIKNKISGKRLSPYLLKDSSSIIDDSPTDYAYPSKMPSMIAFLAMQSLQEYLASVEIRKDRLKDLINIIKEESLIPAQYNNKDVVVVPLRLALSGGKNYRNVVDSWVWFLSPIIATDDEICEFHYKKGQCPTSERIGQTIGNLPIYLEVNRHGKLVNRIKNYKN